MSETLDSGGNCNWWTKRYLDGLDPPEANLVDAVPLVVKQLVCQHLSLEGLQTARLVSLAWCHAASAAVTAICVPAGPSLKQLGKALQVFPHCKAVCLQPSAFTALGFRKAGLSATAGPSIGACSSKISSSRLIPAHITQVAVDAPDELDVNSKSFVSLLELLACEANNSCRPHKQGCMVRQGVSSTGTGYVSKRWRLFLESIAPTPAPVHTATSPQQHGQHQQLLLKLPALPSVAPQLFAQLRSLQALLIADDAPMQGRQVAALAAAAPQLTCLYAAVTGTHRGLGHIRHLQHLRVLHLQGTAVAHSLISTAVLQLCNLRQLEFAGDLCMHPLPDLKASHLTALTLQQSAEEAELEQLLDTYTNLKHLGVWLPEATSHGFQKPCRSSIVIMHRIQLAIQQWVMAGGAGDGHLWLMEHLPLPLRRTAQALAMALSHHGPTRREILVESAMQSFSTRPTDDDLSLCVNIASMVQEICREVAAASAASSKQDRSGAAAAERSCTSKALPDNGLGHVDGSQQPALQPLEASPLLHKGSSSSLTMAAAASASSSAAILGCQQARQGLVSEDSWQELWQDCVARGTFRLQQLLVRCGHSCDLEELLQLCKPVQLSFASVPSIFDLFDDFVWLARFTAAVPLPDVLRLKLPPSCNLAVLDIDTSSTGAGLVINDKVLEAINTSCKHLRKLTIRAVLDVSKAGGASLQGMEQLQVLGLFDIRDQAIHHLVQLADAAAREPETEEQRRQRLRLLRIAKTVQACCSMGLGCMMAPKWQLRMRHVIEGAGVLSLMLLLIPILSGVVFAAPTSPECKAADLCADAVRFAAGSPVVLKHCWLPPNLKCLDMPGCVLKYHRHRCADCKAAHRYADSARRARLRARDAELPGDSLQDDSRSSVTSFTFRKVWTPDDDGGDDEGGKALKQQLEDMFSEHPDRFITEPYLVGRDIKNQAWPIVKHLLLGTALRFMARWAVQHLGGSDAGGNANGSSHRSQVCQ